MNHAQSLFHVLATLAAVIAVGQFCVGLCRRLGQPAVIGQVIAGIALGPSLLGWVAPQLQAALIPTPHADPRGLVVGSLHAISQLGIVLSMFLVGVEFNLVRFRQHARSAIAVAAGSTLIPGLAGFLLALWLHPRMCDESVARSSFALFMGVAMAITAFPILARILVDRRLETSDLGVLALAAAALADVAAWCLLAMVVGVVQSRAQAGILVCLGAALFIAAMFLLVRPAVVRVVSWIDSRPAGSADAWLFVALLTTASISEAIGLHAVFGAFLLGAVIPHDSRVARDMTAKLHDVVTTLLLPAFFAMTGMQTRVGLITGFENWMICLAIIAVAIISKVGGTWLAGRAAGLDSSTAAALGVLMNTRGLMELIVLDMGLNLGIIPPTLFTMMVLMALATTFATGPALNWLAASSGQSPKDPDGPLERSVDSRPGAVEPYRTSVGG